jgi:hypothetical protein
VKKNLISRTPEFARHWAGELGTSEKSLKQLSGGINNQVFRCENSINKWVIKGYEPSKPWKRDNMKAEIEFLRYTYQVARDFTPKLIHADTERRCVILEHIEGSQFLPGQIPTEERVEDAIKFIRCLNANHQAAEEILTMRAAEGFLSLKEHLNNVRERLEKLESNHLEKKHRKKAAQIIESLSIDFEQTKERTLELIKNGKVENKIRSEWLRVSPSDFGFHNAIHTKTGTKFFDFEFSGWDDPAKAVTDFILQPRIPVHCKPAILLEAFRDHTKKKEGEYNRLPILALILRLKWLCIILSVLMPEKIDRVLKCMPQKTSSELIEIRLEAAFKYLKTSMAMCERIT